MAIAIMFDVQYGDGRRYELRVRQDDRNLDQHTEAVLAYLREHGQALRVGYKVLPSVSNSEVRNSGINFAETYGGVPINCSSNCVEGMVFFEKSARGNARRLLADEMFILD